MKPVEILEARQKTDFIKMRFSPRQIWTNNINEEDYADYLEEDKEEFFKSKKRGIFSDIEWESRKAQILDEWQETFYIDELHNLDVKVKGQMIAFLFYRDEETPYRIHVFDDGEKLKSTLEFVYDYQYAKEKSLEYDADNVYAYLDEIYVIFRGYFRAFKEIHFMPRTEDFDTIDKIMLHTYSLSPAVLKIYGI